MSVGLVLVSHSAELAQGLQTLAKQMAPDVPIRCAGGTAEKGIGTSYDLIESAAQELLDLGHQVLFLSDLGSATMTVEMVIELLDGSVRFVDVPFVEGTIAAAVAAAQGDELDQVAEAALAAIKSFVEVEVESGGDYSREAVVADAAGLHARPAAALAVLASQAESDVFINDVDAESPLMVMGLGIKQNDTVTITSSDAAAVDRIAKAIEEGLD
ncbi:dihydroxyacetone kinase phosphoryl donor subunit DhaM [Corynebacterium pelargi]|uniref:Phosphocarrier protein HPr n=1 Tax=Corynebacterium pelargi TaxID=1471400 RepID=A0A410WBV2_9CORY|nr:dihydroxyacetone kinase phosphoryl donor subunit DhaM [Corynebacterium pelargi]QAU53432.1 PTS-dependent dihydroxyacetone kinase, phosphotransferase subunit DhaM [Corynebacterium pelargi]GGG82059.1 PTS sugar transporter subunit IIA [Corynebacterium pelargi]